nr:hypothetical protein [Sneathiella sp. P13V-1]
MANVAVGFHHGVAAGKGMDDAIVLNIGTIPDHDPAEIAPHACPGSDVAPMPQDDISDQNGLGVDICILRHNGYKPFEFITVRHSRFLSQSACRWFKKTVTKRSWTVMLATEGPKCAAFHYPHSNKRTYVSRHFPDNLYFVANVAAPRYRRKEFSPIGDATASI